MFSTSHKVRVFAVLLGIIFLAAQFHFCSDLNAGPGSTHPCQLCSAAGSALAAPAVALHVTPFVDRLEIALPLIFHSAEASRSTSPRAPPVL